MEMRYKTELEWTRLEEILDYNEIEKEVPLLICTVKAGDKRYTIDYCFNPVGFINGAYEKVKPGATVYYAVLP